MQVWSILAQAAQGSGLTRTCRTFNLVYIINEVRTCSSCTLTHPVKKVTSFYIIFTEPLQLPDSRAEATLISWRNYKVFERRERSVLPTRKRVSTLSPHLVGNNPLEYGRHLRKVPRSVKQSPLKMRY